jgi:ribonuclease H-related protein
MKRNTIHLFIDGSFHDSQGAGYGFVAVNSNEKIVYTEAEPIYDPAYLSSTSAELIASLRATKWALKQGYTHINIHHDYTGVHEVATQVPVSTNPLNTLYFTFFSSQTAKVYFHKVPAHSGNFFNTRAHQLAKQGRQRNLRRTWLNLYKRYNNLHPSLSIFQAADRSLA